MSSSTAQTLYPSADYVESYSADPSQVALARRASKDLGIEAVSPATSQILTMLAKLVGAKAVVEVGTGAGVSSLAFFAGMPDDGVLTSLDVEAGHHLAARESFKAAGIAHTRFRLITGEALNLLPKLRAGAYDIVFIDADLLEYPEYLEEGLRIVRGGGLVILYHALLAGKVADDTNFDDETMLMRDTLEAARQITGLTVSLIPVGDGLLVCTTAPES